MLHERILIPSSGGYELPLEIYVPDPLERVDQHVRRPAVVICPGGGYYFHSEREDEPIALRFVTLGFNAFVVRYRVEPNRFPLPQQDAAAAVAYVRAHAEDYHTDLDRIAVMGFSAGGHLAASLGTLWHRAELWQEMGLTPEQVRPNALVLGYPVISGGAKKHCKSFVNLSGSEDEQEHEKYSIEGWVTENCPPVFLWHTFEDELVPVQNALIMSRALIRCGVLNELHIFPHGAHGLALADEAGAMRPEQIVPEAQGWPEMAARFLRDAMKGGEAAC